MTKTFLLTDPGYILSQAEFKKCLAANIRFKQAISNQLALITPGLPAPTVIDFDDYDSLSPVEPKPSSLVQLGDETTDVTAITIDNALLTLVQVTPELIEHQAKRPTVNYVEQNLMTSIQDLLDNELALAIDVPDTARIQTLYVDEDSPFGGIDVKTELGIQSITFNLE